MILTRKRGLDFQVRWKCGCGCRDRESLLIIDSATCHGSFIRPFLRRTFVTGRGKVPWHRSDLLLALGCDRRKPSCGAVSNIMICMCILVGGTRSQRFLRLVEQHNDALRPAVPLHRFLHEFQGCLAISGLGDDALQHLALMIDSPPRQCVSPLILKQTSYRCHCRGR
jgi:hypothetical protein